MSLILIPGVSGSGKSHMLFQMVLRDAQEHPERRYVVLVPEQNTLQTQKTLVSMSERGGIWNIDVLSFTRLAYRVFEQTGVARRQILSETGKVLLLRLIAAREGAGIPLLSGALDRPGVLGELKSILSEMDQYGIGQEELLGMEKAVRKEGAHPALERKLSEIALLQEAFERYQEGHFITGEKLLRVLCGKIPLDETLKGTVLCLDGFTGLTPSQLQVITTLLRVAGDIYVTVTIDPEEAAEEKSIAAGEKERVRAAEDHGLFALSRRTVRALLQCASDAGAAVELLPVPEGTRGRHEEGGELWWLERHLLRPGKEGRRPYPGGGARREIFLRQCADPWDEAVSAAVTIRELTGQGIRCREIAIVCGSLKDYAEYVRRAMSVYEIPCYIDRSLTVVMNPAFEFVRCAIDVVEKNFSYESVMALLRTGLVLDPESGQADLLENYLIAAGIRGHRMWAKPFERQTRDRNLALKEAADNARACIMERFEPFFEVMKKGSALFTEYAGALWRLILAFELPGKLEVQSLRCREEGREDRAQEYAAVPGVICDVLDEAAYLMGEESVSRTQFAEILRAGFSEAKIGILPRGIDQVQVGDLERSRLEGVRVVFFLGLNDGFVPGRKKAGGILTDLEREYLYEHDVRLSPTARQEAQIQQFYLYLTMTKPTQALYLSWSAAKRNSEEMRPSGILSGIQEMFPSAGWANAASVFPFESVTSLRTASGILSQALSDYLYGDSTAADWNEPKLKELVNLFRRHEKRWENDAQACLRDLSGDRMPSDLDEETALALYGMVLHGSITRLEEFSACAFRHFADYGLGLKEREEFAVRAMDLGTLLHSAIEIFSEKLSPEGGQSGWRTLTDEQRDSLARESLRQALEQEHGQDLYRDSSRAEQVLDRLEKILLRSVKTIQYQIRSGAFEPVHFELTFGAGDEESVWIDSLPGGRKMRLTGKIDRIDECADEEGQRLYVKIVDYKSSARDIDLESLIEGEQLQLLVYLDAAARLEQKAHPENEIVCAGAFYCSFQDPVVDMDPLMTKEEAEDAILRSMRVKGLVNGRQDVVERLETAPWEAGTSKVIPVSRNMTRGELRASSSVVTDRQFELLRLYSRDRMRRIASSILSGKIAPNPSRKDAQITSCTWCPYRDVCRFDPRRRGTGYRERAKRSGKENWELIEQAVSEQ